MTGRRFSAERPIRLSDADAAGRLRHDAIARYLQDVAADDVLDAGWAPDEHIWVVRRTVLDVVQPFVDDTAVELTTWCDAVAGSAAARRTSVVGDRGGRVEAEMIWIHLGPDLQPLRLGERFLSIYGASAEGRRASTRLVLPGPAAESSVRTVGASQHRHRPARSHEQRCVLDRRSRSISSWPRHIARCSSTANQSISRKRSIAPQ